MSGNKIFVDTNILIYFLKGEQEVIEMIGDKDVSISFITELELLSFPELTKESERVIANLLKNCTIIELDRKIKDLTIEIRKKTRLKIPDSIVAASAYYMNLPFLTADKQMRAIEEVDVIIYEP
jgi:predicted nucleic acid-binding protein